MLRRNEPTPHRTYRCPHAQYQVIKRAAEVLGMSVHSYTRETLLTRAHFVLEGDGDRVALVEPPMPAE